MYFIKYSHSFSKLYVRSNWISNLLKQNQVKSYSLTKTVTRILCKKLTRHYIQYRENKVKLISVPKLKLQSKKLPWQSNQMRRFNNYYYLTPAILNMAIFIINFWHHKIYNKNIFLKIIFHGYKRLYTGHKTSWKLYPGVFHLGVYWFDHFKKNFKTTLELL